MIDDARRDNPRGNTPVPEWVRNWDRKWEGIDDGAGGSKGTGMSPCFNLKVESVLIGSRQAKNLNGSSLSPWRCWRLKGNRYVSMFESGGGKCADRVQASL